MKFDYDKVRQQIASGAITEDQWRDLQALIDQRSGIVRAFLVWEDDLTVAFRPVADRAAAVKFLIENIDDKERFSAIYCELFADGTSWAEKVNPDHIEWLDECPDCGETDRKDEGTACANCGHVFPELVTP